MKKYYALLIVSALVFACQKPQNEVATEDSSFKEVELTINATNPGTKTYIEKDGSVYNPFWHKGDVIAVCPTSSLGDKKAFTNKSDDGEEALFEGSATIDTNGDVLAAFYPKAMTDGRSNSVFKFVVAENQAVPSLNYFNKDYDLLVAKTVPVSGENPTSVSMQFRRVLAVVKVILKDNTTSSYVANSHVKQVKITSSSAILTGRVAVDIVDDTQDITWENSKSQKDVIGTYNDGYTINGTNAMYLIVNPTTLESGSTLTIDVVTDDTDLTISKEVTLNQDIIFKAGNVTPLTINITDECIAYNLLPTLALHVTEDLNKGVEGGSFTIEDAYAITNCTDDDVIVTADGVLVNATNVSIEDGNVTYSLSANTTGQALEGWIGLNLDGGEVLKIFISQLGSDGPITITYAFYVNDNKEVVQTKDGRDCDYFTVTGTSILDCSQSGYFAVDSFTINDNAYSHAKKIDSSSNVSFTTNPSVSTTVRFYAARRQSDKSGTIKFKSPSKTLVSADMTLGELYDSDVITLDESTTYTFDKSGEVGLFYIEVVETSQE